MNKRPAILSQLFINTRLYLAGFVLAFFFVLGFFSDPLYLLAKILLLLILLCLIADLYLLFFTGSDIVLLTREIPDRLSNGDDNKISVYIRNNTVFVLSVIIIDELPVRFQIRDFRLKVQLGPYGEKHLDYLLRPTERGEYAFGKTYVYVSSQIGLLQRRFRFNKEPAIVRVYPSFLNIRKFEFLAVSNQLTEAGIKRIRKIGQHSEFDQIREYVQGDDLRSINWKATAKKGKLMANQYQDERSQQIYNLIDMGRVMKMPFNHLSLLDYAINSSLILTNTALFKHDKAGLITFNTSVNTFIPAERRNNTMMRMLEVLYNQDTRFSESNYELLFITIKRMIPHRSLLILYSNFESVVSLSRQLNYFQRIARNHLLLVVVFENTEITAFRKSEAKSLGEIYAQTIAEKFMYDKSLIVKELNNHGILSVLTRPNDLSVNLVNKYLELKDRNLI